MLSVPRTEAAEKLEKQISLGDELRSRKILSDEDWERFREDKQTWSDYTAELLRVLFTTPNVSAEYIAASPPASMFGDLQEHETGDLKEKLSCLRSIYKRLELIPEALNFQQAAPPDAGELLILIQQAKKLSRVAASIDPEAADKAGRPGSGITELIKPYNSCLDRARHLFERRDQRTLEALKEIPEQEDIKERFAASYHKRAQQRILTGLGQLLAILEAQLTPVRSPAGDKGKPLNRRVFIVHGREEGKKEAVARFLRQIDMDPIILHEQPSQGRTLIEKMENYSDVEFAVVLLTADDFGCLKESPDDLKPRARQNVVFELGYFFGRLGRKRVCALYEGGVERPSDIEGLVYIPLDDHAGWKTNLAREIQAAGFEIDGTKLLS